MHHVDASLVPPEIINSKPEFRNHVRTQLEHLLVDQRNWCKMENLYRLQTWPHDASSLIYNSLDAFPLRWDNPVNWCGFYLVSSLFPTPRLTEGTSSNERTIPQDENKLLLGPFCGKPACQFINVAPERARGVCVDAFVQRQTILVQNSEIVCHLILPDGSDQIVVGVLDLDCLALSGFDEEDKCRTYSWTFYSIP
ncbi:hypothetical protein PAXINDRAFT_177583 [Paxillus involutus ATCC 200175]|uniref:Unplaced genomic scaffold PAXINscaffold_248, whole genome shotgun sequence n=1 Tax=Paxillus involutus ATCC 200175 TaxID=664439 RepID=A0A0C9TLU0_PAXIN|nr:hypothetical protein PAXINDRAFT_177583 [Paxillus involutus ATCC 200175]